MQQMPQVNQDSASGYGVQAVPGELSGCPIMFKFQM